MIVIHSKFLSTMLGFQDNDVLLPIGHELHRAASHAIFHDGFRKIDRDFLIAFQSNILSGMHGSEITRFKCKPLFDVIVIPPPGSASRDFS